MRTIVKEFGLILFGFTLALILLEVGLRVAGYLAISSQNRSARTGIDFSNKNQYRILCIGESTTAEIFVTGQGSAWPMQMERILNTEEKGPRRYKTINEGVPGTVTAFILARLKDQIEQYRPHLVITMMGINDRASVIKFDEKPAGRVNMFLESFRVVKFFRIFLNAASHGFNKEERPESAPLPYLNEPKLVNLLVERVNALDAKGSRAVVGELLQKHPDNERTVYAIYSETVSRMIRSGKYMSDEFYNEAVSLYKKVLEIDKPRGDQSGKAYAAMTFLNIRKGKWDAYYEACRNAITYLENESDKFYHINNYIWFAKEQNRKDPFVDELTKKYKMSFAAGGRYTATRDHYKKFYAILKQARIPYAAMQYPTRDVRLLKYFFSNDHVKAVDAGNDYFFSSKPDPKYDNILKDDPNILFISNEESFNTALSTQPYDRYFIDRFGGTFGHTTIAGHNLIARNASEALRKSGFLNR